MAASAGRFPGWLRRKQRGALLQFATALGVRRIPFAGANIIVSLSDSSIRDFLEIMGEVYEAFVSAHHWDPKNPCQSRSLRQFWLSDCGQHPDDWDLLGQ